MRRRNLVGHPAHMGGGDECEQKRHHLEYLAVDASMILQNESLSNSV